MRAALLFLLALAACDRYWGREPWPDVVDAAPADELWECSCRFTCWPGDEEFTSVPHRFCASGEVGTDAGVAMPATCKRQLEASGLCGNVNEIDVSCACSCARIGACP